MSVDPKHIVNLKGREFVMYAGLLELAHARGVQSIEVNLLQYPDAKNGQLAIAQATATFEGGKFYTEIGDAGPSNTSGMIAPHACRMAATRAKGRALRDALNIGVTMFEELGEREPENTPAPRQEAPRARYDPKDHAARKAAQKPREGAVACEWPDCGVVIEDERQIRASREYANHPLCVDHEAQLRAVRSKQKEKQSAEADLLAAQAEAETASEDQAVLIEEQEAMEAAA